MLEPKKQSLPTNVVWLTGRTEISTSEGWQSLEHLYNNRHLGVFTVNMPLRKVELKPVFTMSKMFFRGNISTLYTGEQYIEFRYANLIDKCEVFPSMLSLGNSNHLYKTLPYSGNLFTLTVPNQTIFCRNTESRQHLKKHRSRMVSPFVLSVGDEETILEDYEMGNLDHMTVEGEVVRNVVGNKDAKSGRNTIYQRVGLPEYWITKTAW